MPLLHYLERDVIMYNICIGGRVFAEKRERGVDIKVSERSIILAGRQAGRVSSAFLATPGIIISTVMG